MDTGTELKDTGTELKGKIPQWSSRDRKPRLVVAVVDGNSDYTSLLGLALPEEGWTGKITVSLFQGNIVAKPTKLRETQTVCQRCGTHEYVTEVELETGIKYEEESQARR